ncbi:MAG: hypothetical protein AB7V45_09625 [Candidatus Krumholzibacteriia bacterium]
MVSSRFYSNEYQEGAQMSWSTQSRWYDTLEMSAGVLSSIAAIVALTTFLQKQIGLVWLSVSGGFALLFGVAMGFIKLKKAWDLNDRRLHVFGRRVHSISHRIRDAYAELQFWATTPEFDEPGLFTHAARTAEHCVNDLADLLSESSGHTVVATLQYFRIPNDGVGETATDLANIHVETIARSSNCPNPELRIDTVALVDNGAYRQIVSEGRHQFTAPDLESYRSNFLETHDAHFTLGNPQSFQAYKALIVLPIRIAEKFVRLPAQRNRYIIIGFISLDSLATEAFRDDHIKAYCDIGKSCGDSLFHYLKLVDKLQEDLTYRATGAIPVRSSSGFREMKGKA